MQSAVVAVSLAAGGDDFEVLIDGAMAINATLEGLKDIFAFDELAENSLVAVEVGGFAERDRELGPARILAVIGESELTTFIVSHCHVLILEPHAESTHVLLTEAPTRDSKAGLSMVEGSARV